MVLVKSNLNKKMPLHNNINIPTVMFSVKTTHSVLRMHVHRQLAQLLVQYRYS